MRHEEILAVDKETGEVLATKRIDIDPETGRVRVRTFNAQDSRTDKTKKEQCDVNNIMKRFRDTGMWPAKRTQGVYLDHTTVPDYQNSLEIIKNANDAFNNLPSHVRKRFGNDPQQMIEFLSDPKNLEESIKLGLSPEPEKPPEKSEVEKYYATQNAKEKTASKNKAKNEAGDD